MITLSGAGAIIKNPDGHVFMVKVKRRSMTRWELPTRILRKGETIFLALYRCIEEESSSQIVVRIGRPICFGLNGSQQLEHQYFAMFFECTAENCNIKLTERPHDIKLPDESRQETVGASFIDWRKLHPEEIHPQHQQILVRWQQDPTGPLFAIMSDADSELAFYNGIGSPRFSFINQLETSALKGNFSDLHIENVKSEISNIEKSGIAPNSMSEDTVSVLFLSADPTNASRLRLGEEVREIQEKLQLAKQREKFILQQRMSVRPADISQALLDLQPSIVHFSGHGTSVGGICVENQIGDVHLIQPEALAALFEQFSDQVYCVVLNACYSERQANAIAHHINYVIGMNQAIGDKAAIAFSIGFYQALGAGRTIEKAYKLGCVQIRLQDLSEHLIPILLKKE